jgi:small-conductance mechanosensitive channel
MLRLGDFFSFQIGANTLPMMESALMLFVATFFGLWIFKRLIVHRLRGYAEKTQNTIDDVFLKILDEIHVFVYFVVAIFFATKQLVLPEIVQTIIWAAFVVVLVYEGIHITQKFLVLLIRTFWLEKSSEAEQMSSVLGVLIKVALWAVGLLLLLSNLGINVNSLIASMGVGGIAVALALQNILSDMFSSFSIYFDKPFIVGDFIVVGDHMGTVEHIGLKTTRIRALQGEEIVISNQELTSTRVRNFKKMQRRRVVFGLGVEYATPPEKLRAIPGIVQGIIDALEHAEFDRAHFFAFADSSLNFEIVYYMRTSDYTEYMNTQQSINLGIVERFEKEGIAMAFPTRTVHIVRE